MSAALITSLLSLALSIVTAVSIVRQVSRARDLQRRLDASERECAALRGKLADVIDEAGRASATDGGWLAKLLQRWVG